MRLEFIRNMICSHQFDRYPVEMLFCTISYLVDGDSYQLLLFESKKLQMSWAGLADFDNRISDALKAFMPRI
jgi:hypothetical protein